MNVMWRAVRARGTLLRFGSVASSATFPAQKVPTLIRSKFQPLLLRAVSDSGPGKLNELRSQSPEEKDDDVLAYDKQLYNDVKNIFRYPDSGHSLLLIQPRVRSKANFETMEFASLMMDEAVALVHTLPGWSVVRKLVVSVDSTKAPLIFGKGNLQMLKQQLDECPTISAVFLGVDMLSAVQSTKLEDHLGVRVFDRYQIVLKIFHDHARTREAKLQVALAEIPYLKIKLAAFSHNFNTEKFERIELTGGKGERPMHVRQRLLKGRELKLKRELEVLKNHREKLRKSERRIQYPVAAVVGYTNCGKTSLIKSLTNDARLIPEDKLFATLDVTLHAGLLPSSQKVLFVDTVGFISRIPTDLIHSFKSTLEDIAEADVIIHVRDISHPDTEMQKKVVMETLGQLNLPEKLMDSIIEVGNKVDLLKDPESVKDENLLLISATEGNNLSSLVDVLEQKVLENTDRDVHIFKVPNGGEAYRWLRKEATVRDCIADQSDYNYLLVEVIISTEKLSKFTKKFGDLSISVDEIQAS